MIVVVCGKATGFDATSLRLNAIRCAAADTCQCAAGSRELRSAAYIDAARIAQVIAGDIVGTVEGHERQIEQSHSIGTIAGDCVADRNDIEEGFRAAIESDTRTSISRHRAISEAQCRVVRDPDPCTAVVSGSQVYGDDAATRVGNGAGRTIALDGDATDKSKAAIYHRKTAPCIVLEAITLKVGPRPTQEYSITRRTLNRVTAKATKAVIKTSDAYCAAIDCESLQAEFACVPNVDHIELSRRGVTNGGAGIGDDGEILESLNAHIFMAIA